MDVDVEESALKRNNTFRQYLRHAIRVPLHQFISLGEKNAALDDSLVYLLGVIDFVALLSLTSRSDRCRHRLGEALATSSLLTINRRTISLRLNVVLGLDLRDLSDNGLNSLFSLART